MVLAIVAIAVKEGTIEGRAPPAKQTTTVLLKSHRTHVRPSEFSHSEDTIGKTIKRAQGIVPALTVVSLDITVEDAPLKKETKHAFRRDLPNIEKSLLKSCRGPVSDPEPS
jgi:Holliday junction resolvase RusA-like endonuclease